MNFTFKTRLIWFARVLFSVAILTGASTASADTFFASYLAAGVQTPAGVTTNYETFNSQTPGTGLITPFVTNFNGSPYTGTYTGNLVWQAADEFGGAGGTGVYPDIFSGSYSVTISPSVNYFGLWFSALDLGNQLQFYNGSTLLYTFTPADFIHLVGACPGTAFCGNPNPDFLGEDGSQQYAYLNFYDQSGMFNKVVFSELNGLGGFESDNHAVAVLDHNPGGTPITGTPEPATAGLLACAGLTLAIFAIRRVF